MSGYQPAGTDVCEFMNDLSLLITARVATEERTGSVSAPQSFHQALNPLQARSGDHKSLNAA